MALSRVKRFLPHLVTTVLFALVLASCAARVVVLHRRISRGHAGLGLTQEDAQTAHDLIALTDPRRPVSVPRIIHQLFHNWNDPANETVPEELDQIRQSIFQFNPGYEYKLWTLPSSRQFLQDEYPWFVATYDGLPHPVQKVDVLRYFLMRHFGGIYIDLNYGCHTDLDSLLYYPTWIIDEDRDGPLSNHIIGAEPNHPFWIMMTDNLRSYAHDYFSPYITVKYGTGEWFLTLMWRKYHLEMPEHADPLTRLRTDRHPDIDMDLPMFTSGRGLIWEPWDKEMFLWIANHPLLTGLLVTAAAACVVVFLARWCPAFHRGTRGYTAVGNQFHVEGGKAD